MEILLLLLAPIAQIVLIAFRVRNKIVLPVGAITVLSMLAGVLISIFTSNYIDKQVNPGNGPHCSIITMAFFLCGLFISLIIVPIIGIVGGLIWHFSHPKQTDTQSNLVLNKC